MPIKRWCGQITPEPARPVGLRMSEAHYGLILEYIYLGCGEEVGASVFSIMAVVAETDVYGSHRSSEL